MLPAMLFGARRASSVWVCRFRHDEVWRGSRGEHTCGLFEVKSGDLHERQKNHLARVTQHNPGRRDPSPAFGHPGLRTARSAVSCDMVLRAVEECMMPEF